MSIITELLLKIGVNAEDWNVDVENIGKSTDGYHTLDGLYFQRCVLFATLCNTFKEQAWKSRKHADGEDCFDGNWFIVGIDTPKGTYTYYYEIGYWDMFKCKELPVAKEWDRHTEKDVTRLLSLCKEE